MEQYETACKSYIYTQSECCVNSNNHYSPVQVHWYTDRYQSMALVHGSITTVVLPRCGTKLHSKENLYFNTKADISVCGVKKIVYEDISDSECRTGTFFCLI